MVNNTIVSRFRGELPQGDDDRSILGGPLYPREELLALLESVEEKQISLWSRKCIADAAKLELEPLDIAALISKALTGGKFLKSEWCTSKPDGPWAACDAYAVECLEWSEYARRELPCRYYVKFCIATTGKVMIVASCHLEDIRRAK